MKLPMIIMIFLLLGAFFIVSENHLALSDVEAREELGELYQDWLASLINNGKQITSYAVKMKWLPKE